MTEHFLSFIWQHQLYDHVALSTIDDQGLVVLHPGYMNHHSGPDFLHARIKINGVLWVGHVEIHSWSSHWLQHGHSGDPAYENVVLHVVYENDLDIKYPHGRPIPTLALGSRIPKRYLEQHALLNYSSKKIPCQDLLSTVRPIILSQAFQSSAWERFQIKSGRILARLQELKGNWIQLSFEVLMRTWGFGLNNLLFEDLARTLPVDILLKNRFDSFRVEALLLGHAGLIKPTDEYGQRMQQEYQFLNGKYSLSNHRRVPASFLRTRPYNFPTIRLAQVAGLLCQVSDLLLVFQSFLSFRQWSDTCVVISDYWSQHYDFGKTAAKNYFTPTKNTLLTSYLDLVVPMGLAVAEKLNRPAQKNQFREEIESLPAQATYATRLWSKLGYKASNALEAQGQLHHFKNYCSMKKCLNCPVGADIMMSNTSNATL